MRARAASADSNFPAAIRWGSGRTSNVGKDRRFCFFRVLLCWNCIIHWTKIMKRTYYDLWDLSNTCLVNIWPQNEGLLRYISNSSIHYKFWISVQCIMQVQVSRTRWQKKIWFDFWGSSNKAITEIENFIDLLCVHWNWKLSPKPWDNFPLFRKFVLSVPIMRSRNFS